MWALETSVCINSDHVNLTSRGWWRWSLMSVKLMKGWRGAFCSMLVRRLGFSDWWLNLLRPCSLFLIVWGWVKACVGFCHKAVRYLLISLFFILRPFQPWFMRLRMLSIFTGCNLLLISLFLIYFLLMIV